MKTSLAFAALVAFATPAAAETPLFGIFPMHSLSSPAGASPQQSGDIKHADNCGDLHVVDAWGQCLGNPASGGVGGEINFSGALHNTYTVTRDDPPAPPSDGCGPKGEGEGHHGHHGGDEHGHGHGDHNGSGHGHSDHHGQGGEQGGGGNQPS